jgi:hypothetical protein
LFLDLNSKEAKETSRSNESHGTEIQAIKVRSSNSDESSSSDDLAADQLLLICCGNVLLLHFLSQVLMVIDSPYYAMIVHIFGDGQLHF